MTDRAGRRILLAEDDRFLRKAAEAALRRAGYCVTLAVDGDEALAAVRAERPDAILLDLLMPKQNGLEVLRALKRDGGTRDIPVLVLSNSSRDRDVEEVKALGAAGYLVKADLSLDALVRKVAALLER
jgi:two-component system, OmpR family, response regulator MprA